MKVTIINNLSKEAEKNVYRYINEMLTEKAIQEENTNGQTQITRGKEKG